ncbi:hypothetical protein Salat_0182700 [Sesamum alatum]|uniref:RNase H type-1 domain-containing protein n=1 Tax=Sesamum alatum TaxID=300844 RepID=A0AAE2CY81_9LAMI|nr:hypothetical protein Salat_0182700 [Sesamum alatum]
MDAHHIKTIPISTYNAEDWLIWTLDKHGRFTIRSAHHAAISLSQTHQASSSSLYYENPKVWAVSSIPWTIISARGSSTDGWILEVCSQLDNVLGDQFLSLCWGIWNNRNKLVMEGRGKSPKEVFRDSISFLNEFREMRARVDTTANVHLPQVWQPPDKGSVKINSDRAICSTRTRIGIGVIEQQAKLLALQEGVHLAMECGWRTVILESDCLVAIQKLNSTTTDESLLGTLVHDISVVSSLIQSCTFQFIRRTGNSEAHLLAKLAVTA